MNIRERVEQALDRVRPTLQQDGGGIEVIDINEETGVLKVSFQGACQGCPFAKMTLEMGIETLVKEAIPEIKQIVAVDQEMI